MWNVFPGGPVGAQFSLLGVPMRQIVSIAVGLLLVAVLVGCGAKRPKAGTVTGKVSYKGQAVNDASLQLYPTSGPVGDGFTVAVLPDGTFSIVDFPKGDYKVVVTGAVSTDAVPAASLKNIPKEKQAQVKEQLDKMRGPTTIPFPNKYKSLQTTDLKMSITDQDQKVELELKD
jgi:hypothetical protein